MSLTNWTTTSWKNYPNAQAITYRDMAALQKVVVELGQKKTFISIHHVLKLKRALAKAQRGHAFILQAGNCAESFLDCRPSSIRAQLTLMQRMIRTLEPALKRPIIPIGRIAGQYAKPRSLPYETKADQTLLSYRGDLVNETTYHPSAREPDPKRLLQGYQAAKHTIVFLGQLQKKTYFYTSHEALHLDYESALTRLSPQGLWYNCSTHLPWVGVRTTQVDGAHIEFLRGIDNPIGLKVGPNTKPHDLVDLMSLLNPNREAGKVMLITRLGAHQVAEILPPLIQITQLENFPVTWACDPMHGNTEITSIGIKTRRFDMIWKELKQTYLLHQMYQSNLGGIHLEITPDMVTECLGGYKGPTERDLSKAYKSLLDPRLNPTQSLEIAEKLAGLYLS